MANGLISQMQSSPANALAEDIEAEQEETNLTEEEERDYRAAMEMVSEIIYVNDESSTAVVDQMRQEEPALGVADAAMFLMSQIEGAYQGNYPEQLILPVVDEVIDVLIELGETAGIFKGSEELEVDAKNAAAQQLVEEYGADQANVEAELGDITQQDVEEMHSIFGGQYA